MKKIFAWCVMLLLSNSASAAPPVAPDSLRAVANSYGHIELFWSHGYDDGYIVGYELLRNGSAIPVGDVTEYYDSDIASNSTYTYRIVAIDNNGERTSGNSTVTIAFSNTNSSNAASTVSLSSSSAQSSTALPVCVDEDGDGWGWDGYKSCLVTGSTTSMVQTSACLDPDGDGWGWDGSRSCVADEQGMSSSGGSACVDSDGDGWGWDGSKTCKP